MKDRIQHGANLLENHVFQFDFLNDDFSMLPDGLQNIINDEKKRKKLVIFINPPYAEGDNVRGIGRKNVQISKIHEKYQKVIGKSSGEIFAQFFIRIFCEISNAYLAEFSTLKILQAPNFEIFRNIFVAKLKKMFIIPANTFDNVNGQFPIGFMVWDTCKKEKFAEMLADIYDKDGKFSEQKNIVNYDGNKYISDWLEINSKKISKNFIGHLASVGNDFQNQRMLFIDDVNAKRKKGGRHTMITEENLIVASIYFAVRKVVPATWLNDRDQFLYPNDGWKTDLEFQNDCLAYTLFNNNIQSRYGVNHWIPFTEYAVGAKEKFESSFMFDFISGKREEPVVSEPLLFYDGKEYGGGGTDGDDDPVGADLRVCPYYADTNTAPMKREFSETARLVFKAGLDLWKYYHAQKFSANVAFSSTSLTERKRDGYNVNVAFSSTSLTERKRDGYNVNASLYDIREHFQGRNEKGTMNSKSTDEKYNELIENLRLAVKLLAKKIGYKVYEYGFLIN
jgi:hypothetical protein